MNYIINLSIVLVALWRLLGIIVLITDCRYEWMVGLLVVMGRIIAIEVTIALIGAILLFIGEVIMHLGKRII